MAGNAVVEHNLTGVMSTTASIAGATALDRNIDGNLSASAVISAIINSDFSLSGDLLVTSIINGTIQIGEAVVTIDVTWTEDQVILVRDDQTIIVRL